MSFTEQQVAATVALFMWPLLRIGAMFVAVPVFSGRSIPARIRVVLAVGITIVVMPLLPQLPRFDIFSYQGLMIAIHQVFIGLLTGFFLQLVFAAVVYGGQGVAYSMGLGFASMVDPQTGIQVPVVAQFYLMLTTLVFLGMNGHLLLIEMLVDSFKTIPIALDGISQAGLWTLIAWGSRIFSGGVLMALPIIFALLLVNLGFGVATRAAPQLNVFAIGFVVTILLGLWFMWLTLPSVFGSFTRLLDESYVALGRILHL